MTINDFLSALTSTKLSVTIKNAVETVITFISGGYLGVENDILTRTIESWADNGGNINIVMARQTGTLTLSADSVALASVGATDTVSVTAHTGEVTVESSDEAVATAEINGDTITITEVAQGTATITDTSAATGDYEEATETISVTCTE